MMKSLESILHNRALKADGRFHHFASPSAFDIRKRVAGCNLRRFPINNNNYNNNNNSEI
jgi:hypothetical protein